jgi:hypothetical protein
MTSSVPLDMPVGPPALDRDIICAVAEGREPLAEPLPVRLSGGARPLGEGGDPTALGLAPGTPRQQPHPGSCKYQAPRRGGAARSSLRVPDGSPVWRSLIAARLLSHAVGAAGAETAPSYGQHRGVYRNQADRREAIGIWASQISSRPPSGKGRHYCKNLIIRYILRKCRDFVPEGRDAEGQNGHAFEAGVASTGMTRSMGG